MQGETAAAIGDRRELFVDDWLVESRAGLRLELERPARQEIALLLDAPWEDHVAFPESVIPWDGGWRLYYRAAILDLGREDQTGVLALAESRDGITFTRPELGLVPFGGSTRNNILQLGGPPRVPPPFVDAHPAGRPDERLKGIFGMGTRAYAAASPDGLHWSLMQEAPLELPGHFDTVNTAFWDAVAGCYRSYTRSWHDARTGRVLSGWDFAGVEPVRAIQHATSPDFLHWSAPEQLVYADGELGTHLYTNAILPCPGAEHLYLGFPNRFVPDRQPDPGHVEAGVNDALFMSSRDGVHWQRWLDAWVVPGPDRLNWTERNNYPVWGIARSSATEWSIYLSEHYRHPGRPTRVRRLAVRPWGFVAVRADRRGGELLTRPLTFRGTALYLNARTSAAGALRVEVQDAGGRALPGLSCADMEPWFGDGVDARMAWRSGADLSRLAGQPVRLRIVLQEADLFSLRFGD